MRYAKLLTVMMTLLLVILWGVQTDATGQGKGKSSKIPAPVPQTGQTVPYADGDDGDLQTGVPWPSPRFSDKGDGTVKDNLTGLIWLQNANCFGTRSWFDALNDCNTLASGDCGLTDGSLVGDWRLPNRKELESLMDFGYDSALPFRPPFVNFGWKYWTSTNSWFIENNGVVDATSKEVLWSVWPVRDPQ